MTRWARINVFLIFTIPQLGLSSNEASSALRGGQHTLQEKERSLGSEDEYYQFHTGEFSEADRKFPLYVSLPAVGALTLISAFFTLLTQGLMGMDTIGLEIVEKGDDEKMALYASKIKKVRSSNSNQLMCTLMLGNVLTNATLAILAADALTLPIGLGVAVVLTLLFGEVLPQAAFARHTLQVGARMVPLGEALVLLLYLFTYPLAMILNLSNKEMGAVRQRTQLIERLQVLSEREHQLAAADEIAKKVAEGALLFRNRSTDDVMTPLEDAYMLPSSTRLGYTTIRQIFETGFTRIPVYGQHKNDYKGLLVTKDLMLADPEDEMKLGDFITIFNRKVETFYRDTKLVEVLNKFKKGGTHMGLVREVNIENDTNPYYEIRGVVTLEDVIEEILQDEIVDETDVFKDVDKQVKVNDGRESRVLNLAVFNPLWKSRREQLSREEVTTIASHLERVCFFDTGEESKLCLSIQAVEWLVAKCGVQNRTRATPPGVQAIAEEDILYEKGKEADKCTLILQGRVGIRAGRDEFRAEAGAFSVLARDALVPGAVFFSDYRAFLGTETVRLVQIAKVNFLEARELDRDKAQLAQAITDLAAEQQGYQSVRKTTNDYNKEGSPQMATL